MLLFSVAYSLAALVFLLAAAYHRPLAGCYPWAKSAASLGFLLVALCRMSGTGRAWGMLACLGLCAAGDVLLGLANAHAGFFSRFFSAGAVCFVLAHAGFCFLFSLGAGWRPAQLALPLCLVAGAALAARDKHRFRLRRMALPALVYSFFVGLMCAQSVSYAARTGVWLAAAGGALFLASDCVLLFLYFYYKKRRAFRALNLVTYYLGMLCLALTI